MTNDWFGLPLWVPLSETEEQEAQRIEAVETLVQEAIWTAVKHLGPDRATELFQRLLKRASGKHGGRKELGDRDRQLLRALNSAAPGVLLSSLARELHAKNKKLGASKEAIEKRLRELRQARDERASLVSYSSDSDPDVK